MIDIFQACHESMLIQALTRRQLALVNLGRLLGKPMNKLVNEAVRDYHLKTSKKERELEGTLASLRAYRERDSQVREAPAKYLSVPAESATPWMPHREFVHRVSMRHPVKAAMLFGSRARGTHRADSDVDVAILLAGPPGQAHGYVTGIGGYRL